jgi:hypothetical protein
VWLEGDHRAASGCESLEKKFERGSHRVGGEWWNDDGADRRRKVLALTIQEMSLA